MKAAIFIDEGITQIVLTPENEWEKNALKMISNTPEIRTYLGTFYECQGGWLRQSDYHTNDSLIFRLSKKMEIPGL